MKKKKLKKKQKREEELHEFTKEIIENLTDESAKQLLHKKWIQPIEDGIQSLVDQLFKNLETELIKLNDKYAETMEDIQKDIKESNEELIKMMDQLTGSEADMKGIKAFQDLLGGE